ncbi:DUF1476 domain-containing protein [Mangrovibrevibacter kandeliae]|uniref:DUF1476 domain-containing protein n=1 Tax=Mangrovibrevibacter kandeliae TaxID=2968473 RepID=UPI0021181737|nr:MULTISPECIES: DUF1476 domain-containing protein [unclassified Aurantimonas]MCQ8782750.1 DUF1476 domain-containing protein [Aurantimonas sp. CSK15Z-1]MCW4114442.1 DUF1476 domain-containing protein [Aurantimonas sp. MSK8Z-1]
MPFSDREKDFEARYVHDQELRFRIEARRNRLIGLWAAAKLGLLGQAADDYTQDVIRTALEQAGKDSVAKKIRADFDAAGVEQSDHQIERTMTEFLATAEDQVRSE